MQYHSIGMAGNQKRDVKKWSHSCKNYYNVFCILGTPAKLAISFVHTDLYRLHVVATSDVHAIQHDHVRLALNSVSLGLYFLPDFVKMLGIPAKEKKDFLWVSTISYYLLTLLINTCSSTGCCSSEREHLQLPHWHKQSLCWHTVIFFRRILHAKTYYTENRSLFMCNLVLIDVFLFFFKYCRFSTSRTGAAQSLVLRRQARKQSCFALFCFIQ